MPYRKTNYRNKNYSRPRPRRQAHKKNDNMKRMLGHVANKALEHAKNIPGPVGVLARGLGMVKNFINVETKYLDVPISSSFGAGGVLILLNNVLQGAGVNNRNGVSILSKNLTLNLAVDIGAVTTFSPIRMAIIVDKKPDILIPVAYTDIYGTNQAWAQVDKEENGDRFVILKDMQQSLSAQGNPAEFHKFFIDLTGVHILFDDTAGNVFEKNAIYLVLMSNGPSNTSVNGTSRFRFYDN